MAGVVLRSPLRFSIHPTSGQKTLALKVHPSGEVEVRAPRFVRQVLIQKFVEQRRDWIIDKQRYFSSLAATYPAKDFRNGETFPVLGRNYRLKVELRPGIRKPSCRPDGRRLRVILSGLSGDALNGGLRGAVREFYAALTRSRVEALIRKHAPTLAVRPVTLSVVHQAKRWASCSKSGGIRCNWRLSMMPMPVIEYVVVHELCHLKIHDHSPQFWRVLKSVLPDFEKRRGWLRMNGGPLERMFGA